MDPLTRSIRPIQHRYKKKPLSQEVRNAFRTLLTTVILLGIGASGAYLYVNSLKPAKGYLLKELQSDYEALQSIQRKLDKQVIEAESFIRIQNSDVLKDMESTNKGETAYIRSSSLADNAGSNGSGSTIE